MKKIVYSLLISSLAISFTGCDYHDPNEDKFDAEPSAGYVEFGINDNNTPTDVEDDFPYAGMTFNANVGCGAASDIIVPIVLKAPVNKNGLNVNYTVTDIVGSSAGNVTITANIPKNSREGQLVISYPETLNTTLAFKVTLSSTDNSNVGVGNPGLEDDQSVTVKLNKEPRDQFQGAYDVVRGSNNYTASVSTGEAANELVITNLFNLSGFQSNEISIFLNEDGTISFPPPIENYLGEGSQTQGSLYVEGISGSYGDSCEGEFTVTFRLRWGANLEFQTPNPTTAVFTRQ